MSKHVKGSNGYTRVAKVKANKGNAGGAATKPMKKAVWLEVKTSSDIDAKATNPVIHLRVSNGIRGHKNMKYATGY